MVLEQRNKSFLTYLRPRLYAIFHLMGLAEFYIESFSLQR